MMKKIIYYLAILVFALSACKKNDAGDAQTLQQNQNKKTEALILDFKDKIENHLKDGGTYTGDSAVWYVEALLNYSYGNSSVACWNYETDSTEIAVYPTSVNSYSIEQLALVFDYLEADVLDNQPQNTNIIAIDVFTYLAGNLTTFASRTTYASPRTPAYKSLADTSGYWFWGAEKGMCGPDSGLYVGMDVTDILEDLLSNTYNDYWTDVETKYAMPNQFIDPFFPLQDPELYPTRIFSATGSEPEICDFCLSPDNIAYYASGQGIGYIINNLCPNKKQFICCDIQPYYVDGYLAHTGTFWYGIPQ